MVGRCCASNPPATLHSLARHRVYVYISIISQAYRLSISAFMYLACRLWSVRLFYNRVWFACVCRRIANRKDRNRKKRKGLITKSKAFLFENRTKKKILESYESRIFGRRQFIFAAFFLLRKSRTIKNCCVYEFESRVSCLVFSSYSLMTHISIRLSIILVSPHVYMHALSRHAATITDR